VIEVKNSFALEISIDGFRLPLSPNQIEYVRVFSSLQTFLPVIEISVNDKANLITEYLSLAGGEVVEVSYGITPDDMVTPALRFIVGANEVPDANPIRIQGSSIKIRGTLEFSPRLLRPVFCRSWDASSSEVVTALATEMRAVATTIEPTDDRQVWIQPHWTNAQLLRYMAQRAVSTRGEGGYLYGIDRDGRLIYCSMGHLYRQPVRHELATMTRAEDLSDPDRERRAIHSYEAINRKELMGTSGGYGSTIQWFDFYEKRFVETPVVPSDYRGVRPALSDRITAVREDEDPATRAAYIGRVDDGNHLRAVEAVGYDRVWRRMGSALKLVLALRGNNRLRIGDKVSVLLSSADPNAGLNQVYSGEWVLERVIDNVSFGGYWTKVVLVRDGINQAPGPGGRRLVRAAPAEVLQVS
jgi:hypothetical protein